MSVNTKQVPGRRSMRYDNLDELLADAQRLSSTEVRTLGNWSQGQIYEHLARALDASIDGAGFTVPAPVRWLMSTFMKRKFLTKRLPSGFQAPAHMRPEETSVAAGLASLEKAVARQKQQADRAPHPVFGDLGREGWNDFNLRHAELHMSFILNGQDGAN